MGRAVTITAGLIGLLLWGFSQFYVDERGDMTPMSTKQSHHPSRADGSVPIDVEARNFLPMDEVSEIIHHRYYSLGYNEKLEIPNWVAYKLTEESLRVKNVPRADRFKTDPDVDNRSAKHSDYSHSGYTRGHMAPAGDMAFSKDAMQESFYMSNMTPQLRQLNNGIWRELEENVRDWAYDNDEIYVVSGPLFDGEPRKFIGKSTKVAVPDAFFKAILDIEGSKQKSIGFIIPHEKTDKHIRDFAVTIDEIERVTGYDFFQDLILDDDREESLESEMNVNQWQIDKKRFNQRVNNWNKQK